MGRCPWHGEICNCGLGYPFPENGLMPERCEVRTPLYQVGAFPNQSRRKKEYEDWVKAGKPRLEPDDSDPSTEEVETAL